MCSAPITIKFGIVANISAKRRAGPSTYLVWISRIHPAHLEHVLDLVSKPYAGPAIGCDEDPGDAFSPGQLRGTQEQQIFFRPKRSNLVGDVIADDDGVSAFGVFRGFQLHFEGDHPYLETAAQNQRMNGKTAAFHPLVEHNPASTRKAS